MKHKQTIMLPLKTFSFIGLLALMIASCKKQEVAPSTVLKLTPPEITGKSGHEIEATLFIQSTGNVGEITMYKTVNLERDNSFGNGGTFTAQPVSTGDNSYRYDFTYRLQDDEIDKLVGFNFRVEDGSGAGFEKDLTVHTTTSGRTILYTHKWKLQSRTWTSVTPNVEDMKSCEGDNLYYWNEDSTYAVDFGTDSGAGDCQFDGFNVFEKWTISEDEKTFTQRYHSLFDPSNVTTETFTIKELTSERFVIQQTIDLTIFGLTDHETFVSTYVAVP